MTTQQQQTQSEQRASHGWAAAIAERINCFTWAWFTIPMGTCGVSVVYYHVPYQFPGLYTIGDVVYVMGIVFFCLISVAITVRFTLHPSALRTSWYHPTESLFIPTCMISIASICFGFVPYAEPHIGPWFVTAMAVVFWSYTPIALGIAVFMYMHIFTSERHTLETMTPAWMLPLFPILLAGAMAGFFAPSQSTDMAVAIIIVGLSCLGLSFLIACLLLAIYLMRLMMFGLPEGDQRTSLFIALGPSSFLVISLISLGKAALAHDSFWAASISPAAVFDVGCVFASIFVWTFGLWIFLIAFFGTLAAAVRSKMSYKVGWWAMIFPNASFTVATSLLSQKINWGSLKGVACTFAVILTAIWLFLLIDLLVAVWTKRVLKPFRDPDKSEGYFMGDFAQPWPTERGTEQQQQQQQSQEREERANNVIDAASQRGDSVPGQHSESGGTLAMG